MAHECNAYCAGTTHCVEVLAQPNLTMAQLYAGIEEALGRDEGLMSVAPAPEADVAHWQAMAGWTFPVDVERHTQPWLAFVSVGVSS